MPKHGIIGTAPDSKRRRRGRGKAYKSRTARRRVSKSRVNKSKRRATKFIKGVVQKVLHCATPTGHYVRNIPAGQRVDLSVANKYQLADKWTYGLSVNNDYQFYTGVSPMHLMDAISVVYNNKAKAINHFQQTGNFVGSKTQVDNVYMSKKYEYVNLTEVELDIEIWKVTPNVSSDASFLQDWQAQLAFGSNWVGGVPTIAVGAYGSASVSDGLVPSNTVTLKDKYKISKVTKKVLPGAKFSWFSSAKLACFDFSNFVKTDGSLYKFHKGFDQYLMKMKAPVRQARVIATPGTVSSTKIVVNDTTIHIAGWITEHYKFDQPPNTDDAYEGDARAFLDSTDQVVDADEYLSKYNATKHLYPGPTKQVGQQA